MVVVQENLIGDNGVVHMIDCIMYVQPSSDDDRLTQEIKEKYKNFIKYFSWRKFLTDFPLEHFPDEYVLQDFSMEDFP